MALDQAEWKRLEDKAHELRKLTLETVIWAGSGHIGGSLSAMDVLTALYHHEMNFKGDQLDDPDRDRFVLSKGHIGVGFAPVLSDLGCFPKDWLKEYNHTLSPLGMHPCASSVPGVEVSTGSLGHGLSISVGMAIGAKLGKKDWRTYTLLGDGECCEGSVWEAAMSAANFKLDNMVAIVDRNTLMMDGPTEDVMAMEPFVDKWKAFGWEVFDIDGNNISEIVDALDKAKETKGKPSVFIANTVKGAGIDFIAGDYKWHYGAFADDLAQKARESLDRYHEERLARVKGA